MVDEINTYKHPTGDQKTLPMPQMNKLFSIQRSYSSNNEVIRVIKVEAYLHALCNCWHCTQHDRYAFSSQTHAYASSPVKLGKILRTIMTALRENCPDSRASTSKMMCLQWGSLIYTLEFTADSPRSTPAFVSNAYFRGVGNPRTTSGLSVVNPGLNWRAPVMQNSTRREYWPQEDTHKPQSRFKKKKKKAYV